MGKIKVGFFRTLIISIFQKTKWIEKLYDRALFYEVGKYIKLRVNARTKKETGLKPLNRFERWLFRPYIQFHNLIHNQTPSSKEKTD